MDGKHHSRHFSCSETLTVIFSSKVCARHINPSLSPGTCFFLLFISCKLQETSCWGPDDHIPRSALSSVLLVSAFGTTNATGCAGLSPPSHPVTCHTRFLSSGSGSRVQSLLCPLYPTHFLSVALKQAQLFFFPYRKHSPGRPHQPLITELKTAS